MNNSSKNIVNIKGMSIEIKPVDKIVEEEIEKPKNKRSRKILTTENITFVKSSNRKINGQQRNKKDIK